MSHQVDRDVQEKTAVVFSSVAASVLPVLVGLRHATREESCVPESMNVGRIYLTHVAV